MRILSIIPRPTTVRSPAISVLSNVVSPSTSKLPPTLRLPVTVAFASTLSFPVPFGSIVRSPLVFSVDTVLPLRNILSTSS